MSAFLHENRIILAIDAIGTLPGISICRAAKMFDLPEATIRHCLNSQVSKVEATNRNLNLTVIEEEVIVQYIMQLDSQGFSPRRADVEDMANVLLAKCNVQCVRKQ